MIGYMEGAAEEEEELKTKRVPKHSEACGNAYMVDHGGMFDILQQDVVGKSALWQTDAHFKPRLINVLIFPS